MLSNFNFWTSVVEALSSSNSFCFGSVSENESLLNLSFGIKQASSSFANPPSPTLCPKPPSQLGPMAEFDSHDPPEPHESAIHFPKSYSFHLVEQDLVQGRLGVFD